MRARLALGFSYIGALIALAAWAGWHAPVGPNGFDQSILTFQDTAS